MVVLPFSVALDEVLNASGQAVEWNCVDGGLAHDLGCLAFCSNCTCGGDGLSLGLVGGGVRCHINSLSPRSIYTTIRRCGVCHTIQTYRDNDTSPPCHEAPRRGIFLRFPCTQAPQGHSNSPQPSEAQRRKTEAQIQRRHLAKGRNQVACYRGGSPTLSSYIYVGCLKRRRTRGTQQRLNASSLHQAGGSTGSSDAELSVSILATIATGIANTWSTSPWSVIIDCANTT